MKVAYITIPITCDWRGGNRPFVKIAERVPVFLKALEEHSTALRKVRLQAGDSDLREANWAIGHNLSETRQGCLINVLAQFACFAPGREGQEKGRDVDVWVECFCPLRWAVESRAMVHEELQGLGPQHAGRRI